MNRRVLIVDDDAQMVRTLADVLAFEGWQADGVTSGVEAVVRVEQDDYAAVVMDLRMPEMNGLQAFRQLRRVRPALPVILMTAFRAGALASEAERAGALQIIPKPVNLPRLAQLLHHAAGGGPASGAPGSAPPSTPDRGAS